jgi:hypothetical protein
LSEHKKLKKEKENKIEGSDGKIKVDQSKDKSGSVTDLKNPNAQKCLQGKQGKSDKVKDLNERNIDLNVRILFNLKLHRNSS